MDPRSAHAWSAAGAVFPYGTLMGHEAVATVEKVGPEVKALKPGDRVAVNGSKPCGECVACKSGMVNACVNNLVNTIGNGPSLDGAFADRVYLPDIDVTAVKIPDHLSAQHGAFTEPAATGIHAIRISNYKVGDSVAVVGAGPIGLLVTAGLKAAGAGQIIVSQRPGARPLPCMGSASCSRVCSLPADGFHGGQTELEDTLRARWYDGGRLRLGRCTPPLHHRGHGLESPEPVANRGNLEELTRAAYVKAFQTTLGVLAAIVLLAIMVASFICRVETEDNKDSRKRMAVV